MRRRELLDHITALATPIYGRGEAIQIALMILEEMCGVSRTDLIIDPQKEAPLKDAERVFREVAEGRPIQYIIGEADFFNLRIAVREGVLIPRPESEELIRWIANDSEEGARVLDIGTGSGALAIALRESINRSKVTALDISDEAIEIATENIKRLAPSVKITKGDALQGVESYVSGEFDVIVSNPPYIPQSEEVEMRINVTKYEPHLALFVPDNDPLIFYRSIARSALQLLSKTDESGKENKSNESGKGGKLYFEIHERLLQETIDMLRAEGFANVKFRLDINDKPRMICAQRE
ncbi:MAG: peptide chain release factor N(5)-glutamine methyltransferase [Rikenellaceae bacterium]